MKNVILVLFILAGKLVFAQDHFSNCSAVFLEDKMIVEEYSKNAKCKIAKDTKGWISAGTVSLGEKAEITSKFAFGIAIKDAETGTITMFSPKIFKKIEAEKVLAKCKRGDSVIIMTTDDEYSLPHNELLVY
ncbi:hypothetical protein EGI22_00605 [Lacihabitans sp. LS3-19]|uniref:hypothetical protein n=1 Tax=Lacihabitans sp. LS3-19 TaxID=2487335 RepID=UPI0020CEDECF|nr:hypothetical protein [Lacihabitans sp. LS3-19]MCP9766385.1 hypothetical protein [Lacihabitans sp. LS3-19]